MYKLYTQYLKYLVHFCFSFSIISQIQSFSHTVLQSDKKSGLKRNMKHYSINIIE